MLIIEVAVLAQDNFWASFLVTKKWNFKGTYRRNW